MSGHQFDDRLSDIDERAIAEAEADLSRLLSIEPSPDLAAKVRARIRAERVQSRRWFTGWQLGLAAASLVIVGIVVTYAMRRGPIEISQPAPVLATVQPPPTPPAPATTPARAPDVVATNPVVPRRSHGPLTGQRPAETGSRIADRGERIAEPEVLVPADQRIAIARALAMSRTGALDERMFAEPLPAVAEDAVTPVPPIVVDEVVVPPITVPGGGIEKGLGRD